MCKLIPPFLAEQYCLSSTRDGSALRLNRVSAEAADMLGPATAAMGPWASYGFDGRKIAATLKSPRDNVGCYQVEYGKEIAGVAVVVCPWLSGPYLQMLAVLPRYQKQGIGAAILAWYEAHWGRLEPGLP